MMRYEYAVVLYLENLMFGGPEEGGWWYSAGEKIGSVRLTTTREEAVKYCARLNAKLKSRKIGPNRGRRAKSSVLSDGVFEANVYHVDAVPERTPLVRPHYE